MQQNCAFDRRDDVISAVRDDPWNALEARGVEQQFTVAAKEAAIQEVMAFDPGESDGIRIGTEPGDAFRLWNQR